MGLFDQVRYGKILVICPEDRNGQAFGFIKPDDPNERRAYFQEFESGADHRDPVRYRLKRGKPHNVAFDIELRNDI